MLCWCFDLFFYSDYIRVKGKVIIWYFFEKMKYYLLDLLLERRIFGVFYMRVLSRELFVIGYLEFL